MLNEDELKDAALLVFANKQDQPGAKGAGEISEALRLGELRDRNWSIVACSAVDGRGVDEGMDWLVVSTFETFVRVDKRLIFLTANRTVGLLGQERLGHQHVSSQQIPLGRRTSIQHIRMEDSLDLGITVQSLSHILMLQQGVRRMFELGVR